MAAPVEIAADFPGLLRLHKDGTVHRYFSAPYAAPSPSSSVLSKDINITFPSSSSASIPARIYLPSAASGNTTKLPVVVYFHGGGFCVESAFSARCHRYVNHLAAATNALVVSVDYRLAPEHPLPAAYHDAWTALQWVASYSSDPINAHDNDPWLATHGDLGALFIGGDSAGANIAHNLAIRAGGEELPGRVKIKGAFLFHSYFIDGSGPGPEPGPVVEGKWSTALSYKIWELVYPGAPDGPRNPMIDPFGPGAPSLAKLGCSRVMVVAGGVDELREVNVKYYEAVRGSGYGGEVVAEVVDGEGHAFQVFDPESDTARALLRRLGRFVAC